MPLVLADRVRDTTTTTGTGTVTLSGTAPTGYQNFSVIGNGNTTYYTINAGSQWEVGLGTYSSTGPTLSRDTVLSSSNAGALVNFSAGTKDVFVTYPSADAVYQDGSIIRAGSAALGVTNGGTGATTATAARTNIGATTVGSNFFTLTNPSAITFPQINADNTVSALSAATFRAAIGAGTGSGTVTSVAASGGTTGLTFTGSPITTSGTLTLGGTLAVANGGTGSATAAGARTNLGGTTVGSNFFTLTNPTAITFPRINADNTVSALDAATFRTAIGAGTGNGTVTSVAASGGTTGLTFTGSPITTSGTLTVGGTLAVANGGTGVTTSTGSGSVVLSTSPTLVTPTLGAASATSIANALGAAATPSYTFTGNTTTGLFSPSANIVSVATAGSEKMRVTAGGDVLIGTTTADQKLTVNGSVAATGYLIPATFGTAFVGYSSANSYIGFYNSTGSGGVTNTIDFFTGSTQRMRVDSSGNVTIAGGTLTVGGANVAIGFQSTGQQVISTNTALGASNLGTNILVTSSSITLTLPTSAASGKVISISNISNGNIVLSYTGSAGTDGPTTMAAGTSLMLVSDGGAPPFWRAFFPAGGFDSSTLFQTGYKLLPQNQRTGAYTLALADSGKHIYATAANFNITIPANASVAFPIGTAITFVVEDQFHTLVPAAGVTLVLAGTGAATTGTRTLAQGSVSTIIKVGTDRWYISGSGVT